MSIAALLGFALGALAALGAAMILIPMRWQDRRGGSKIALSAAAAVATPLAALLLLPDGPPAVPGGVASDTQFTLPAASGSATPSDGHWSLLSHMYLGGPPPGAGGADNPSPSTARASHSAEELTLITQREPDNVEAWLTLANTRRQARDFPGAVTAYERALKLDGRSADTWADYADALASANGKHLAGPPAAAIARALQIDQKHLKGLWLQASLDIEQKNYVAALAAWKKLRAALPPGSQDARIIDANIAEAQLLATGSRGG